MARPLMRWLINLNPLKCHDEGDGIGDAEPYLWTIFFKCDGSSLMVSDAGKIEGSAVIFSTPGSHGNLNRDDVDEGDSVFIPSVLGSFGDSVIPIPVAPAIQPLLGQEDLPGFFGVVVVLMEEDNVTDDGAEAGHQALNAAVQVAIDRVLQSLGANHQVITPEDIASVTEGIDDAVSDAISDAQGVFANIWSWLNADDQIGNQTFVFNQDQFVTADQPNQRVGTLGFSQRWRNQGDWEIFGAMALTEICLANSIASILAGKGSGSIYRGASSDKFEPQLAAMRAFRNRYFHRYDGLQGWWNLAARNTAQMGYLMMRDAEMRKSAAVLLKGIADVVEDLDAPLPKDFLNHAQRAANIASMSNFRRLRLDASQAEAILRKLKRGATGQDALKLLSKLSPGRYPKKKTPSAG
ncbi:MAG: hypothetical protein ABI607_14665 [Betaproteobacteria bacterium]